MATNVSYLFEVSKSKYVDEMKRRRNDLLLRETCVIVSLTGTAAVLPTPCPSFWPSDLRSFPSEYLSSRFL